jgi:hypothetical protein
MNPGLQVNSAIARVRNEYIPQYARQQFPEHASQAEALRAFGVR